MKLVDPTDFEILEVLAADGGKRNTAANIALLLDKDRAYLNTRLPELADYDLITRIGPAEKSGLYEITEKGRLVVQYQDQYERSDPDFETYIEQQLTEQTA